MVSGLMFIADKGKPHRKGGTQSRWPKSVIADMVAGLPDHVLTSNRHTLNNPAVDRSSFYSEGYYD